MANGGPMGLSGRGCGCGYIVLDTAKEVRRDSGYMYSNYFFAQRSFCCAGTGVSRALSRVGTPFFLSTD
jgi:hypothetical protein